MAASASLRPRRDLIVPLPHAERTTTWRRTAEPSRSAWGKGTMKSRRGRKDAEAAIERRTVKGNYSRSVWCLRKIIYCQNIVGLQDSCPFSFRLLYGSPTINFREFLLDCGLHLWWSWQETQRIKMEAVVVSLVFLYFFGFIVCVCIGGGSRKNSWRESTPSEQKRKTRNRSVITITRQNTDNPDSEVMSNYSRSV